MTITELKASNFKRLEAVQITPAEHMNIVSGKNAQGKSSVLDAIMYGFAGPSRDIPKPVKDGEGKAKIEIKTEEYTITRVITPTGQKLTVTSAEGREISSPQKFLDGLFNAVAIDPVRFTLLDGREQVRTLIRSLGLDEELSALDAERSEAYTERTVVNRKVKELEASSKSYKPLKEYPSGELESATEVSQQLQAAVEHNAGIEKMKNELVSISEKGKAVTTEIEQIEEEMKRLQIKQAELLKKRDQLRAHYQEIGENIVMAQPYDLTALQEKMEGLETRNALIRTREEATRVFRELKESQQVSERLTEAIEAIDKKKLDLVRNSHLGLPIEVREDELYFNGTPLKQCSSAEQIKVSTAIAMKLQPEVKVIIIREGSLLDSDSMRALEAIAQKHGYQIWLEKVDDTGTVGIVIEEGKVRP